MRRCVFVDSWGWLAWAVEDDPAHRRAEQVILQLKRQSVLLLTSNFVVAEALTRLRYDFGLPSALALADTVGDLVNGHDAQVVVVNESLWELALTWFRRFDDQRFSFVDCTSFAIMQDLAIQEALTADRHFATAGFVPLGV